MRLVLLGPPGAGKGTQAKLLFQHLNAPHISTGDILREAIQKKNPLREKAAGFMQKGELVPDKLVTELVSRKLGQFNRVAGFILDGFPRTVTQAKILDEILQFRSQSIDKVFYFDAHLRTILQRLTGRRVCSACGVNFHLKNMPPKKDLVCDFCAAKLYQREDDKEETIKKRLEVYRKKSRPLIKYYEDRGILKRVNADLEAEEVFKYIVRILKRSLKTPKNS